MENYKNMGEYIMGQIGFYCPDGESVLFKDCLTKCRMGCRCVSSPTLRALSKQRIWDGMPSTTQLLCGTRYALLKIIKEYFEDVQNLAWILLGNRVHKSLEDNDIGGTSEIAFRSKVMTGILDHYDEDEHILWDYKTSGSYKVHKAIGLVKQMITDPSGERYKRSGKGYKAGEIKKIAQWYIDENQADRWEWTLQTNRYALWLEDDNYLVKAIKIEAIVRDGGLKAAAMYGLNNNIAIINIPLLKREYVLDFFDRKANMLRAAIATGWAPVCSDKECWSGRKCKGYCPVSNFCEKMPVEHPMLERFKEMEPEILC